MDSRRDAMRTLGLVAAFLLTAAVPACAVDPPSDLSATGHNLALRIDTSADQQLQFDQMLAMRYKPAPVIGAGGHSTHNPIQLDRALLWGTTNIAAMVAAYKQSQSSWGESTGKFHFKSDWKGDGMAMSDEVSHLFAAYRLHQVLNAGHRWTGMSPNTARRLATLESWFWTFAVEYPIDAYNPGQGFGVSDLLFNTAGVIAAHVRSAQEAPRWDVKISVKQSFFNGQSRIIAHSNKQYDDYIYWATYRPIDHRYFPLHLGIGYSTHHEPNNRIAKQIHLGIGTTFDDLGGMIHESIGHTLRPLNFLYFNISGKVVWR